MPENFEFVIDWSDEDLDSPWQDLWFSVRHARLGPAVKAGFRVLVLGPTLVVIAAIMLGVAIWSASSRGLSPWPFFAVGVLAVCAAEWRVIRRTYLRSPHPRLRIGIDATGISVSERGGLPVVTPWSEVSRVMILGRSVLIFAWPNQMIATIFQQLIQPHGTPEEFRETCLRWMKSAGGGDERAFIRRHLAHHDPAPCVNCGHNLHAGTADVCPECGTPITLKDQPGLFR